MMHKAAEVLPSVVTVGVNVMWIAQQATRTKLDAGLIIVGIFSGLTMGTYYLIASIVKWKRRNRKDDD